MTGARLLPVTVGYATADGTGKSGTDYQAATGTLTFAPGEVTKTISVYTLSLHDALPIWTFTVNLSSPTQATIGKPQGLGTITDDDAAPVLSVNDVSVTEGNSGATAEV